MLARKKALFIIGSSVALVLVIIVLVFFYQDPFETSTAYYKDLGAAQSNGVVNAGWLPNFMPDSSHDIYEKHNFDYNRGIIMFSFNDGDVTKLSGLIEAVPAEQWKQIRPFSFSNTERWCPKSLVRGEFEKLVAYGYHIYGIGLKSPNRIADNRIQTWFLALDEKNGKGYIWY